MYITQDDGDIYVDISNSERIKLNADQATHIRKKISDNEVLTIDYDDIKQVIDGFTSVNQTLSDMANEMGIAIDDEGKYDFSQESRIDKLITKDYVDDTVNLLVENGQIGGLEREIILPTNEGELYTSYPESIIGLEVVDYEEGRRFAAPELKRPTFEMEDSNDYYFINYNDLIITYTNDGGSLDKPALLMICSDYLKAIGAPGLLSEKYYKYNAIVYFYENTNVFISQEKGIATLQKGWYIGSTETFEFEPIDIEKIPFCLSGALVDDFTLEIEN